MLPRRREVLKRPRHVIMGRKGQGGTDCTGGWMNVTDNSEFPADSPVEDERKYRAPALEKGLDILELMARSGSPLTITQISSALGRSVSELFRIVQALEYKRYIELSGTGDGYVLTNRLFALSWAQMSTKSLYDVSLPVMRRLAKSSTQSCHLVVASGDQMVTVARIEAPGILGFSVRIGYRRPIIDAASGVALFAFQPRDIREGWLEGLAAHAPAERVDAFLVRAEQARADGYASAQNDFVQGVIDLSAPVMENSRVVAALSIPFVHRLPPRHTLEGTAALLRAAAAEISRGIHTDLVP